MLGVAWALAAAAYLVVAWAFWVRALWRVTALVAATAPSLAPSIGALRLSWVGIVIDVVLLAIVAWLRTHRDEVEADGTSAHVSRRR